VVLVVLAAEAADRLAHRAEMARGRSFSTSRVVVVVALVRRARVGEAVRRMVGVVGVVAEARQPEDGAPSLNGEVAVEVEVVVAAPEAMVVAAPRDSAMAGLAQPVGQRRLAAPPQVVAGVAV
jgi:hypothetical protein